MRAADNLPQTGHMKAERTKGGGQMQAWASFLFAFYPVSHSSSLPGSRMYPTLLQSCLW